MIATGRFHHQALLALTGTTVTLILSSISRAAKTDDILSVLAYRGFTVLETSTRVSWTVIGGRRKEHPHNRALEQIGFQCMDGFL